MKDAPQAKLTASRAELAFRALAFRAELDELLERHGAKLALGWDGKWAKFQIQFTGSKDTALTVMEIKRGGRVCYVREIDEA